MFREVYYRDRYVFYFEKISEQELIHCDDTKASCRTEILGTEVAKGGPEYREKESKNRDKRVLMNLLRVSVGLPLM